MAKQGSLSINSENIFPIIKKWLYSDHDIFVRELVSNGCDAITKLKKLEVMGEYTFPDDYKAAVQVVVDPDAKTLKFIDNGIGMTGDEVEEYITQIAFSGATEFLEKYKDKTTDDQMIGHFGLGFYSAFMVADEVHIDTLSYKDGATAVHWTCDGGTEYDMQDGDRTTPGTEITLFLNEESLEFCNEYRMREVIEKYCSFMPVNIYLSKANAEQEYETIDESELRDDDVVVEHIHEDAKTEEKENENGEKEVVEVSPAKDKVKINKRPVSLSDPNPLWMRHPNECSDEDYKDFYRKVFMDYKEPLFWIHLNMDYPFNLKGILYFPKINTEYDSIEGTIKLYNNQVFIADNIKEVIPEFLLLLKGVIDCPDLPLNVSRSALQNDGFVQKISEYISKKVADKLTGMCKTDRESYEKYWDDISPFIKYGCIKDAKFAEKLHDYILFKDLDNKYMTLKDCIEQNKKEEREETSETKEAESEEKKDDDENKEPEKTTIFYVTDPVQQSQYINMFKEAGKNAVILSHNIDTAFISHLEQKDQTIQFKRIDADVTEELKGEGAADENTAKTLTELFRKAKANGIHTTLDTSGNPFTREEPFFSKFNELMKYTDLVMLDIKHIDDEQHKILTGCTNKNILDLARYLSDIKKPVWIRHVLVPERSDYDEYLIKLDEFIQSLDNVQKVEVLPYHTLGAYKWDELGYEYKLKGIDPPSVERVENANQLLHTGV